MRLSEMDEGRPVPITVSGAEVIKDCILCGLPYSIHDRAKDNWLACPNALLDELAGVKWDVQGRTNGFAGAKRIGAPDNLRDWLLADNRYSQLRGRQAALKFIADLWWKSQSEQQR